MRKNISFFSFRYVKIITLLIFATINLSAQQKIYTLDEAIRQALANNKDIKISSLDVNKANAAVKEAFGYALPSLDLSANLSHFFEKPKTPFPDFAAMFNNATYSVLIKEGLVPDDPNVYEPVETKLQSFTPTNNYTTQLSLTQTLFSSAVFEGIGASKIYYNLSVAQLNNTVSKTVLDVQKAFYGVILAKAVLDIAQASFDNAQENFDNVTKLYKEGMVSEFDKLQAEVQLENIRPNVLQMQNTLINSLNGLKIILGVDQSQDIDVSAQIEFKPYNIPEDQILIDEAIKNNFDITSLKLKSQVDEAFVQLDISEYWPTLAAFANYSYAGFSEKWDFQNYSSFTVGLNFRMNLWQGNRTKNAVQQSTITYKQTEEQLNLLKDAVTSDVKKRINELKRAQSLIEVQQNTVKVAQRAYEIADLRYTEGAGSQLELHNADLELRNARLNLTQSVYSYMVSRFELEQLLGRTNSEYLSTVNNEFK